MIGDRIRERRIELGMTQEELAHRVGFKSKSSVNKIELGQRDVSTDQTKLFAKVLDVSPMWLLDYEGMVREQRKDKFVSEYGEEAYEFFQKYLELSERNKIRIEERIDMLLEEEAKEKRQSAV